MALRRSLFSALLLTCLLALSGCGGPGQAAPSLSVDPASAAAASSPPPTPDPRPTQASSTGPARNLPKPVLPEVAKQNTKEGFEAFTQYWFDVATYAFENNEPEAIRRVSSPDCKVCNFYISDASETTKKSGWAEGPRWRVVGFISDMSLDPLKQTLGQFLLEESPSFRFDSEGKVIRVRKGGNDNRLKEVYAVYEDGRWLMAQLGQA